MHTRINIARWFASLALAVACGCDLGNPTPAPNKSPAATPVADSQPAPPPATTFAAGYDEWTAQQATERLTHADQALSAAVRLVRLSGQSVLCVPPDMPNNFAERLAVVQLSDDWFALGFANRQRRRLRAPVLISADGEVTQPVTGFEQEVAVLYVAKDPDVFPHLIVTPTRVLWISDEIVPALVGRKLPHVTFAWTDNEGFPYIALRLSGAAGASDGPEKSGEVAKYTWDPYEYAFMGPLIDKLPDPPGGEFELDLKASQALVPVGGEIPEPEPLPQAQDQPPAELPPF